MAVNKGRKVEILLILLMIFAFYMSWALRTMKGELSTSSVPIGEYKIYLITMDKLDQFWYSINAGALKWPLNWV